MFQINEQDKTTEKDLNKIEMSDLFKKRVQNNIHNEVKRTMCEQSENFNKEKT